MKIKGATKCGRISLVDDRIHIGGAAIPECPTKKPLCESRLTIAKGRIFVDGYEYVRSKGSWKKTLRAKLNMRG